MRECPSCALDFEDEGQDRCPYCGYEFPRQKSSLQWVAWLLVILMLWPALKGVMWLLG